MEAIVLSVLSIISEIIRKMSCQPEKKPEPVYPMSYVTNQFGDSFTATNSLDAARKALENDRSGKTQEKVAQTIKYLLKEYDMCTVHREKMESLISTMDTKYTRDIPMHTFTLCQLWPGKKF